MKIIKALFASFLIGIGIGSLVELCISFATGKVIIGVPGFVSSQSSEVIARLKSFILYGGFGVVGTLAGMLYEKENISTLFASLFQLFILLAYYALVGLYLRWFSLNNMLGSLIIFIIIFFIIWSVIYFSEKRKIDKINKKLNS